MEIADKISGMKGIASSITEFMYGCRRIGISPRELKDGRPIEEMIFDEPQLTIIGKGLTEESELHIEKIKMKEEKPYGNPNFTPKRHEVNFKR